MEAVAWSDYLCPWCYVGLDRSALLRSLGLSVTYLPYELHPEIPPGGFRLADRPGARADRARALYDRIAAECDEVGLPFRRPGRLPNTRRALQTAEWVRRHQPEAFWSLHTGLFRSHFVEGAPLDDAAVIDGLVEDAGADAGEARRAVDGGELDGVVRASMERALDTGVAGTPAWWVADRLLIPGLQSREWIERMVTRLRERLAAEQPPGSRRATSAG